MHYRYKVQKAIVQVILFFKVISLLKTEASSPVEIIKNCLND